MKRILFVLVALMLGLSGCGTKPNLDPKKNVAPFPDEVGAQVVLNYRFKATDGSQIYAKSPGTQDPAQGSMIILGVWYTPGDQGTAVKHAGNLLVPKASKEYSAQGWTFIVSP